jgi:hypothetical protein
MRRIVSTIFIAALPQRRRRGHAGCDLRTRGPWPGAPAPGRWISPEPLEWL